MQVKCDCGQFTAEILELPKQTPGRAVCYCDDCRTYLKYLNREDLLDSAGGSEIIPVYPSNFKVLTGLNHLQCTRLSPKGLFRFWVSCCKTPLGNCTTSLPWIGLLSPVFTNTSATYLEKNLGPITSRIMGKFATSTPPIGTSETMGFSDFKMVAPFILKGLLTGKKKPHPFFDEKSNPVVAPSILSLQERNKFRSEANKSAT